MYNFFWNIQNKKNTQNSIDALCKIILIQNENFEDMAFTLKYLEYILDKRIVSSQLKRILEIFEDYFVEVTDNGQINQVKLFSKVSYEPDKRDLITLHFTDELKPALLNLKNSFHRFNIEPVFNIKSEMAKRLYLYLKLLCEKNYELNMKVMDVQKILDSNYNKHEFNEFHRHIKATISTINNLGDITLSYELIKSFSTEHNRLKTTDISIYVR